MPAFLDPRITAQDLNENLILAVGGAVLEDMAVEESTPPSILWIPMTTLMPAIAEISKKAGH
jgi:hypothetical protein